MEDEVPMLAANPMSDRIPFLGPPSDGPRTFVKLHGANTADDHETWEEADTARTLNAMGQAGTNGALVAEPEVAATLRANGGKDPSGKQGNRTDQQPMTLEPAGVRRLTPTECERLQSFPDGWTAIPR